MSLFPRTSFLNEPASFQPLFRLLDDFDSYSNKHNHRGGHVIKSFTPKFDVKEAGESYELHGELPGVEQSNVEIEFTDAQTLVVRGRTERSYTSGTPPAGFVDSSKTAGAIEGQTKKTLKATVEDEDREVSKTTNEETEVANGQGQLAETVEPKERFWVSERSVGEFSRSFTFPVRVDSDRVQASMKNGILSIIVPKSKKDQARKITIS